MPSVRALAALLGLAVIAAATALALQPPAACPLPPADAPTPAAPQTFLSAAGIAAVRDRLSAPDGPERAAPERVAYDGLLAAADAALALPLQSVVRQGDPGPGYVTQRPYCGWQAVDGRGPDCRDGEINPAADRGDYRAAIEVAAAARSLALAWLFSGRAAYADRAIALIEGWTIDPATGMTPRFTDDQSHIELFATMPGLAYAADLLRGHAGWPGDRQGRVRHWFRQLAADAEGLRHTNNFENWRVLLLATVARLSGDDCLWQQALARFAELLPRQIDADGFLVEELDRADSLSYSLFALDAMVLTAELARPLGLDLYRLQRGGRSLEAALDRVAPAAAGAASWRHPQQAELAVAADTLGLFEPAAHALGKPAYRAVLRRWGWPMEEPRVLGPVSLTHAGQQSLETDYPGNP